MEYVEFLRVRRMFTIFASVVSAIAILVFASIVYSWFIATSKGHVGISFSDTSHLKHRDLNEYLQTVTIPLGLLLGIASYVTIVFATFLSSSLNKENDGLDFVFVKPMRREVIAVRYIATDIVGILAIFAFALVALEIVPLALLHVVDRIVVDARAFWVGGLGLGVAFMWYGILQAVTATYRGKGGTIVGFSWGVFGLLTGIGSITLLGSTLLNIVHVLNLVNPIAYFSGILSHGKGYEIDSVLGIPLEGRVFMVWAIACVSIAIATFSWRRVEA